MRGLISIYLSVLLVVLSMPTMAFADECKTPIAVTTPCSGVLLPSSAAEEGLRCLRIGAPKLTLELKYQKDLFLSQKSYYELILTAERKRSTDLSSQIDILIAKPLPKESILESPVFWTIMGVIIGAGATIGIAYSLPRN